jgi:nucleoside-diphosphate-sugar epimerase
VDATKAFQELGWHPRSASETLREIVRTMQAAS